MLLGALRAGYRCFHLRSCRTGTRIELCKLLVHISFGGERDFEPGVSMASAQVLESPAADLSLGGAVRTVEFASRLQKQFRVQRERLRSKVLVELDIRLRRARLRAHKARVLITSIWFGTGVLLTTLSILFYATPASLWGAKDIGLPGGIFLGYTGSGLMLMGVLPTDVRLVSRMVTLIASSLVAVTLFASFLFFIAGDGTHCRGYARRSEVDAWDETPCGYHLFTDFLVASLAFGFLNMVTRLYISSRLGEFGRWAGAVM